MLVCILHVTLCSCKRPSIDIAYPPKIISKVREWTAILPDSFSLRNAYRARGADEQKPEDYAPVPQSFSFMKRKHMPRRGQGLQLSDRVPVALRTDNMEITGNDVFVMVKETMAATGLSQDPLLVMPGKLLYQSQQCLSMVNSPSCPVVTANMKPERKAELHAIYRALKADFPHMRRALSFYETLMQGQPSTQRVPKLTFLEWASVQNQQSLPTQMGPGPQGPKPHELQVRFHRSR